MNAQTKAQYIISEDTLSSIMIILDRLEISSGIENAKNLIMATQLLNQVQPLDIGKEQKEDIKE